MKIGTAGRVRGREAGLAIGRRLAAWLTAGLVASGCSDAAQPPCGGKDTCPSGYSCQDRGQGYRCWRNGADGGAYAATPADDAGGGGEHDAGTLGPVGGSVGGSSDAVTDAGPADGSSSGTGRDAGATPPAGSCSAPAILFLIDGSSSMCAPFDGLTRWTAVRAALLDDEGVLRRSQAQADLGVTLFDGSIDSGLVLVSGNVSSGVACDSLSNAAVTSECPHLIVVQPAANNADAIDAMYPTAELGGSTPTDKAMAVAETELEHAGLGADPRHPAAIVLVTDGTPNDFCVGGAGGDGSAQRAGAIAQVDRAASMGIRTFAINLASGTQRIRPRYAPSEGHLRAPGPLSRGLGELAWDGGDGLRDATGATLVALGRLKRQCGRTKTARGP